MPVKSQLLAAQTMFGQRECVQGGWLVSNLASTISNINSIKGVSVWLCGFPSAMASAGWFEFFSPPTAHNGEKEGRILLASNNIIHYYSRPQQSAVFAFSFGNFGTLWKRTTDASCNIYFKINPLFGRSVLIEIVLSLGPEEKEEQKTTNTRWWSFKESAQIVHIPQR